MAAARSSSPAWGPWPFFVRPSPAFLAGFDVSYLQREGLSWTEELGSQSTGTQGGSGDVGTRLLCAPLSAWAVGASSLCSIHRGMEHLCGLLSAHPGRQNAFLLLFSQGYVQISKAVQFSSFPLSMAYGDPGRPRAGKTSGPHTTPGGGNGAE